jgi:hypothetical protein
MDVVKDALEKAGKTLEKVGTVLVDRRAMVFGFIAAVLLAGSYFGLDQALSEQITAALQDTYSASVAVLAAVSVLLFAVAKIAALVASGVALIKSWEKRPPSGLNFKSIAPPKA